MECLYNDLLLPDLYSCDKAAKFIDALISPEIDTMTEEPAERFCQRMPATDDVIEHLHSVCKIAIEKIRESGTLPCFFVSFKNIDTPITLISPTPTTKHDIQELLCAGKCLAFCSLAQSIFFVSEIYHENGKAILGRPIPPTASWGIQVIGSSARGNSFQAIINIQDVNNNLVFSDPDIKISRDKVFDYPFSRFFDIKDEYEMSDILSQLPTLSSHYADLTEHKALTNFAITMKALLRLGYHR